MLEVPIDKILPVTEARDHLNKLVDELPQAGMYVLTKGGKPSAILISVDKLKELTGKEVSQPPASAPVEAPVVESTNKPQDIQPAPEQPQDIQSQTPLTPPERYEVPEPPANYQSFDSTQDKSQSLPGGPAI